MTNPLEVAHQAIGAGVLPASAAGSSGMSQVLLAVADPGMRLLARRNAAL
jgi:hypothetical protein